MQKKLLSGLFWVLLANLLVKPFWILGVEVGVQNAVGNEVYGFYFSIFNLAYILNILLDLGVTNFNTRNIAQHPQLIGKHLSGILGIKVCLLGLYLVVAFTVGALLGYGSQEFRLPPDHPLVAGEVIPEKRLAPVVHLTVERAPRGMVHVRRRGRVFGEDAAHVERAGGVVLFEPEEIEDMEECSICKGKGYLK